MNARRLRPSLVAALVATLTVPLSLALPGPAQAGPAQPATRTSSLEAARVDRVPTPRLGWYRCFDYAECATVDLPLDYDDPTGPTTEVAVLRVKAGKPARRIGTLFLNPGGPGGSGTQIAYFARYIFSQDVLDRFDIVGFDPRGTNFSDNVRCFRDLGEQAAVLAGLQVAFPFTDREEAAAVRSARGFGRACSTTGQPLAGSMSTAEVARDMDVLRRAVGDSRLTYLGWSYGSYLGQVYANLFPDRVRAVVIDGVLDPLAWTGSEATKWRPQTDRLRSADGAYRALREILVRCDRVGRSRCSFAAGDPVRRFDVLAKRLQAKPAVIEDPFGSFRVTYADFIGYALGALYGPEAGEQVTDLASFLWDATDPAAGGAARRAAAGAYRAQVAAIREQFTRPPGWDFPYDNSFETFAAVLCTDGLNPSDAAVWPQRSAAADRRAPYFGRLWSWSSVQCAMNTWTARDEDAYAGPFTARTNNPVLVVGNIWDPATNYEGAVTAARLLPNSRLLSSTNWGHTAFGTSACATGSIERYLLTLALPAPGTVCIGDKQPFDGKTAPLRVGQQRPPISPLVPIRLG